MGSSSGSTMARYELFLRVTIAVLLVACASSLSAHVVVFGPASFHGEAGKPVTRAETFTLSGACQSNAVYTLIVANGVEGRRVSSGEVALNGVVVISERDWNQGASELRADVRLLAANSLSVTLKGGARDADVSISVVRHIDVTQPVLQESLFRKTSTQSSFETSFSAMNLSERFTLVVTNGDEQQSNRAASAIVSLNGAPVVGRDELTPQGVTVSHDVPLQTSNRLKVEIDGAVGATVRVLILRHLSDAAGPALQVNLPPGAAVVDTNYMLTGRLGDSSGVARATLDGVPLDLAADGSFARQLSLKPGLNHVALGATDCEGNASQKVIDIALDIAPPAVSILTPAAGSFLNTSTVAVNGTVTDDVSVATVSLNGQPTALSGNAFSGVISFGPSDSAAIDGLHHIAVTATDSAGRRTTVGVDVTVDATPPIVVSVPSRSPSAEGWYGAPLSVSFACADLLSGVVSCSPVVTFSADVIGAIVTGTAKDKAGNTISASTTINVDATPPVLKVDASPQPITNNAVLTITGVVSDSGSGLRSITCNSQPAALWTGNRFQCSVHLSAGSNTVSVEAIDRVGNQQRAQVDTILDAEPPALAISSPAPGTTVNGATTTVSGTVTDNAVIRSVSIQGVPAAIDNGAFAGSATLADGDNTIKVVAIDTAGNESSAATTVTRFSVPTITISSPPNYFTTQNASMVVTGTVSDSGATVRVNGLPAVVTGGSFSATVPLAQGRTVLTAVATNSAGHVSSADVMVYRDSIPPRVAVYGPADGATVFQSPLTVTGMVDDIVVGTVNSGQVAVTVNGVAARVDNRAFIASVPLATGENTLIISAVDGAGNRTAVSERVTLLSTTDAHLEIVSGDAQAGKVGATLPQPLTVRLTDGKGTPIANRRISFTVIQNSGVLTSDLREGRSVTATTDALGRAAAAWQLGSHAGAGNQRVEVRADGVTPAIVFAATGTVGAAYHVAVDLGDHQFGAVNQALPQPLVAVVFDAAANRVAGVPVTFSVLQGGGSFDGNLTATVVSDSDGRAVIRSTLGPDTGQDNNVFVATARDVAFDATFRASGRRVGPVADTRISGVVLDNANMPIAGVSIRLDGTPLVAQTNAAGQFALANVPVGYVKLFVDGSTAQRAGVWPMLEYPMYTIAGQDNVIGMPVYLLPIDLTRGIQVDERKGGTLTFPELPGFSLTVIPGSVTFPSGSRAGTVSVTLVHSDKMPMPPSAGQQPRFIVTIQPPGTHFDPPAPITFPNLDALEPGQIVELTSFDHDLGQFVAIGTGMVSEDGSTIRSEAGVGIIKGGWHGVSLPPTTGNVVRCNECSAVVARVCSANPARAGTACRDDGNPCTEDVCVNGSCVHNEIVVRIGGITTQTRNIYVDRDDPSRTLNDARALSDGQPVYSNSTAGDLVAWRAFVENVSMRTRVSQYKWTATGPETHSGPAASEWMVSNMNWKPGTYTISCEIRFDTGCTRTATYQQRVGIRTDDYVLYGTLLPTPENTSGVSEATLLRWNCPLAAPLGLLGEAGGFNQPLSPAHVPETTAERLFVVTRLLNLTADIMPNPTDMARPRFTPEPPVDGGAIPGIEVFGVSAVSGFRQAMHAQFKYLVNDDGTVVWPPSRVGEVFSITGNTPAPCSLGAIWFAGEEDSSRNDTVEPYANGKGFSYIMKIRGGSHIAAGQHLLLRRELPWVFFRLRFETSDGAMKSSLAASSDSWDGTDDNDFSAVPTFVMYKRSYAAGEYRAAPVPGFPLYQDVMKFFRISPPLPGSTGPVYP